MFTVYPSPVGNLTIAGDETYLTGLWIEGQAYFGAGLAGQPVKQEDMPVFAMAKQWLDDYFSGRRPSIEGLPLAPAGSPFRQAVWRLLRSIPYGHTITYGDIAKQLGNPRAAQAVGNAVGHNPISILIPCHRVVGANGSLTGYAGGIEKKIMLLELEGVDTGRFWKPKNR